MSAKVMFILFAFIGGGNRGDALASLGYFENQATCDAARTTIAASLKTGKGVPMFGCVASTALNGVEPSR